MAADQQLTDEYRGTTVFLLGAGCSEDVGIPLMSRFMERARALFQQLPSGRLRDAYADALDFWNKCAGISKVFDRWWDDIEQLYTQAELSRIIEGQDETRPRNISLMIWDVCRQPYTKGSGGYHNFAKALFSLVDSRTPRPVVITTNYDVSLELAAIRTSDFDECPGGFLEVAYPGFDEGHPGFRDHRQLQKDEGINYRAIEVIKLHGSANWLEKGTKEIELQWRGGADSGRQPDKFDFQAPRFEESLKDKWPLIIPPALSKAADHPVIVQQWKRAVHALTHAREIVVAGYSFPETDVFMSRLLAEGVRNNKNLNRVAVVDCTSNDNWWNRIERMFARSWFAHSVLQIEGEFAKFTSALSKATSKKQGISPIDETVKYVKSSNQPAGPAFRVRNW